MKKFLAILLSLMMLLSMATSFAFANETADENEMPEVEFPEVLPDVYTVADFTEEGIVVNKSTGAVPNGLVSTGSNVSNVNQVDFFGYDDTNRSLEWNMQPMEFYVDLPVIDWNEYAYVNFRFYAPVAGQTFNYVYMGPDKFTSSKYYQKQIVTTGGWQVVTVPISNSVMQTAIAASADKKSMGYMIFSNNGWLVCPGTPEQFANKETFLQKRGEVYDTYTYKSILNEKVYFDKIWLEKSTVDYLDADSLKNGDDDEIQVIKSYAAPANAASETQYSREYNNARPGGAEMYTKVSINPLTSYNLNFFDDSTNKLNIDGWNYINVWVYSPRPQAGGIVIWASNSKTSSTRTIKLEKPMTVNWEGWKLFSYKIPDNWETNKGIDNDPTTGDLIEFKIGVGGWDGGAYQYKLNEDGTYSKTGKILDSTFMNRWHTKGEIGIECAYFSKNEPALANQILEVSNNSDAPAFEALETDKVIYEATSSDAKGSGTGNLTADSNNERAYDQTARSISVWGKYVKEIKTKVADAVVDSDGEVITPEQYKTEYKLSNHTYTVNNVVKSYTPTNTFATLYTAPKVTVTNEDNTTKQVYAADEFNSGIEQTDYINLWMYNPGIKYDQFGNYSEFIFQLYYGGIAGHDMSLDFGKEIKEGTTVVAKNKTYKVIGIPNNWEGWKLISIPVSVVGPDLQKSGAFIGQINIATSEWVFKNNVQDSSLAGRSYTHNDTEKANHYRTGGNFNTFVDKEHYFMVDRVWISKEKPAQSVDIAIQHGTDEISVNNTVFTAQASDTVGRIDGEFSAYKRIGNEVTDVTDEFTFGYEGATFTATYNGEELEYGASYIINWPEFYSANGNKFEAGSSFYRARTVAYEIGSFTVDQAMDSASVSMKGNVPAASLDNVIVAAVYDEAEGVKTLANVSLATYNAENGEIKAEITAEAGQVVTFMYLDSKISVKPLEADVSYTK